MMNNKGQFSIIAALLVAVVLVASVVTTYSAIRYNPVENQPQILSAIDETNLALKQILGFTVGYYGSVLQVTGNSSYAKTLATNYLDSGLQNVADVRPEWGTSFNVTTLTLSTNWFTNASYSQGNLNITYDLTGLGITGIAYTASCRLDVTISPSNLPNQVSVSVIKDDNEPVVGLGASNFKFYLYQNGNLTWGMQTLQTEPLSSSDGTYTIEVPTGINPQSFAIQVQDTRGISVAACSFSHFTAALTYNTTTVIGGDYVDQYNSMVDSAADMGAHSNFTAQQQGPDNIFDTLTEAVNGTIAQPTYPSYWNPIGSTTCINGDTTKLASNDGVYMTLGSYGSAPAPQTLYAHQETSTLGSGYRTLSLSLPDQTGTTLSASAKSTGKKLIAQFDYPLAGVLSIPACSGTIYYQGYKDSGPSGYFEADFVVRQANGNLRTTLASNVAVSGSIGTSWSTLSGGYSTPAYTVVSQTDYLEVDINVQVTTKGNGNPNMYLRVDDNTLAASAQTRITSFNLPTFYTLQAEFTGSATSSAWTDLKWAIDSSATVNGISASFQLYKPGIGYSSSGDGYQTATLTTTDALNSQTITSNPTSFLNSTGYWKLQVTATLATTTPFDLNFDMLQYSPDAPVYALNMQEQWNNVNVTYLNSHPALCINIGSSQPAGLAVDAWSGGSWHTISNSLTNGWNNISVGSFLAAPDFTIRFRAGNTIVQKNWQIDAALLRPESDEELFLALENPSATVAVQLLQNGTMQWLGQNLNFTTQTIPIPPIPVKSIHINETIDGVNQEVPFQIEDWASSYTVPLGLTSNATVFGNRQMVVFLVNTHVSDFTMWWNGSDQAIQTPLAYASTSFTSDNPASNTLSNGKLKLQFGSGFTLTSTDLGSGTSSTASFMRINGQTSAYGAGIDYVIYNGVVRDVVQQEAEWSNGVANCPNFYADIVLTLPANATYFTYQLSLAFLSSQQTRTITELCPINITSTAPQLQTENGTANGDPIVATGTQAFNSSDTWIHHWSQFTDGTNGAGIMFTDQANQMLYTFDSTAPATFRGALKAGTSPQTIALLPVTLNSVTFQNALDVSWCGAVATFDSSSLPIYGGYSQPGLWVLAELPPTITVNVGN